jgi:hypothetical protein
MRFSAKLLGPTNEVPRQLSSRMQRICDRDVVCARLVGRPCHAYEWFNPSTHIILQTGTVTVGKSQSFTAPFGGVSVLWLHK